jgi:hypothetical protein
LLLEKLFNKKTFLSKKNLIWLPEKYFHFILGEKYFLEDVKKLRNVMLFIDYIKFDLQTFD